MHVLRNKKKGIFIKTIKKLNKINLLYKTLKNKLTVVQVGHNACKKNIYIKKFKKKK